MLLIIIFFFKLQEHFETMFRILLYELHDFTLNSYKKLKHFILKFVDVKKFKTILPTFTE